MMFFSQVEFSRFYAFNTIKVTRSDTGYLVCATPPTIYDVFFSQVEFSRFYAFNTIKVTRSDTGYLVCATPPTIYDGFFFTS